MAVNKKELTREEYKATKDRMGELQEQRRKLLDSIDWPLGEKGLKINARMFRRAEEMGREIIRLNKKLVRG